MYLQTLFFLNGSTFYIVKGLRAYLTSELKGPILAFQKEYLWSLEASCLPIETYK